MQDMQEIKELFGRFIDSVGKNISHTLPAQAGEFAGEVVDVHSVSEKVEKLYANGFSRGENVGWPCFDELYRPRLGEFTLVTGEPGSGKSTFLDNIMIKLVMNKNWKFVVFSAENLPAEEHMAGLISIAGGFPFNDGPSMRISREDMRILRDTLLERIFFLDPKEDERTIERILLMAEYFVTNKGAKGIIVDPYNELDFNYSDNTPETKQISKMLSRIRYFVRNRKVHLWIVAHPRQQYRTKEGKFPEITLNDVCGSHAWKSKADMALIAHRDWSRDGRAIVESAKVRFLGNGRVGKCMFSFDKVTRRFEEICLID